GLRGRPRRGRTPRGRRAGWRPPGRGVGPPLTCGAAGSPLTFTSPPISALSPRPRTNTACGARTVRASRTGAPDDGGGAARGAAAARGGGGGGALAARGPLISRTSTVGKLAVWPAPISV